MLSESSLTNTLTLSGISNIRYRGYTQSYPKSTLLTFLTYGDLSVINSPSYIKNEKPHIAIIEAFQHLLHLNIPSVWQIIQSEDKDSIALELWVFWFDDRHTGIIDNYSQLKELKESKVGSFNWDQLISNGLSPTASPQPNQANNSSHATLVPGSEYKLFIKSIRNLIHTSMIARGAFPLGEFFILPDTYFSNNDIIDTVVFQIAPTSSSGSNLDNTMLACMYNVYLTSSNLVFQPNTRRMRIRPLTSKDKYSSDKNKKVLLCPTGEHATLISFNSLPNSELKQQILEQWAEFYHLKPSQLTPSRHLPSLITIRTASNVTITYPTMLVFVPTDTKLSPSAVSGLNGIMGINHGLTEDLGAKVLRSKYHERLNQDKSNSFVNYWSYRDPVISSGNTIIDSLSTMDTNYQQDQILLHRALLEPVVSSPIMNAKSVIPINSTPILADMKAVNNNPPIRQHSPSKASSINPASMDLSQFTRSQFLRIPDDEQPVNAILNELNSLNDPKIVMHSNESLDVGGGTHLSAMMKNNLTIDYPTVVLQQKQTINNTTINAATGATSQSSVNNENIEQPETIAPLIDDFNLMYDLNTAATSGGGDPWDTNEDFGDLDLDVTEADFDFFKTPAPAPVLTPSNVLNIISMDASPIIKEEEKRSLSELQQEVMTDNEQNDAKVVLNGEDPMDSISTPNNDSLFTPFVISANTTENANLNATNSNITTTVEQSESVTPIKADENNNNTLFNSVLQRRLTYQKSTPEPYTFIPRDFLPVPVNTISIDAKYGAGGKFMYDPSSNKSNNTEAPVAKPKNQLKREIYNPDYVPIVKKKNIIKHNIKDHHQKLEQGLMEDIKMEEVDDRSSSSSSSTSGSDDESDSAAEITSSSTTDSSTDNSTNNDSEKTDYCSSDDSIMNSQMVDERLRSLKKFQKSVVQCLLKATLGAPLPTDRLQLIDYDTPFAPVLADGHIKPIKWRQSRAMEQSLDYLCQQAIWGGYPFSEGLSEVSENGGDIEGEPHKVLVARRSNMMQITRGVVTHVPSLLTDLQQLTLDFKSLLKKIFVKQTVAFSSTATGSEVTTPLEEELSTTRIPYLNGPLFGPIDVKGPLNIQQYYNLNESHSQAHSKYGKYQIKKRRPDEPNLDSLKQPDIVVSRNDDSSFLEGSPSMLPFWEKLGLQPYSAQKQVKYLVIYPENSNIELGVTQFFKSLRSVYDSCHLGKHEPCLRAGAYRNGMVPVPLPVIEENETDVKQRLKGYEEICENLGKCLASDENKEEKRQQNTFHIVIYMVNPGPHMSCYLDMCRCFYKLQETYNRHVQHNKKRNNQLVLQLVPIEHILRSSAFGGYSMWGMKDIAFSVYTKCFTTVSNKHNPDITADLYAPPFILSKAVPKTIQFKLDDIRAFPIILDRNSHIHFAYCFSYDRAWMSAVWIDGRGELLEYALFPRKSAYKDAWGRTIKIASRTDFLWTIVITKIGLMFNDELLHWLKYVTTNGRHNKYWVSIIGIDLESGLNLHFNHDQQQTGLNEHNKNHQQQIPTLLDSHGRSISGGLGATSYQQDKSSNNSIRNTNMVNQAQMLLLNHRISYSQKRERAYKGILRTEAITEKENWMTPLATGYLINHSLPNKNVNTCMEQFNNEPFVAELHLIYNHTQHSAYSTLQDIIKRFYALSFVNPVPSSHNCIPFHVLLAERLSRLLLIVDDSLK